MNDDSWPATLHVDVNDEGSTTMCTQCEFVFSPGLSCEHFAMDQSGWMTLLFEYKADFKKFKYVSRALD